MAMPSDNTFAVKKNPRTAQLTPKIFTKMKEYLSIKWLRVTERYHDGGTISTSSRSTRTLQVIRLTWRNIAHKHSIQTTDVDTKFHRCRRTQDITYTGLEQVL